MKSLLLFVPRFCHVALHYILIIFNTNKMNANLYLTLCLDLTQIECNKNGGRKETKEDFGKY